MAFTEINNNSQNNVYANLNIYKMITLIVPHQRHKDLDW